MKKKKFLFIDSNVEETIDASGFGPKGIEMYHLCSEDEVDRRECWEMALRHSSLSLTAHHVRRNHTLA